MAKVHIALAKVAANTSIGATLPVAASIPEASELITSSGASQATTIAAVGIGVFWVVTALAGDVWIKFGSAPTAVAGEGWLIGAGQTREFAAAGGHKCAIINA